LRTRRIEFVPWRIVHDQHCTVAAHPLQRPVHTFPLGWICTRRKRSRQCRSCICLEGKPEMFCLCCPLGTSDQGCMGRRIHGFAGPGCRRNDQDCKGRAWRYPSSTHDRVSRLCIPSRCRGRLYPNTTPLRTRSVPKPLVRSVPLSHKAYSCSDLPHLDIFPVHRGCICLRTALRRKSPLGTGKARLTQPYTHGRECREHKKQQSRHGSRCCEYRPNMDLRQGFRAHNSGLECRLQVQTPNHGTRIQTGNSLSRAARIDRSLEGNCPLHLHYKQKDSRHRLWCHLQRTRSSSRLWGCRSSGREVREDCSARSPRDRPRGRLPREHDCG